MKNENYRYFQKPNSEAIFCFDADNPVKPVTYWFDKKCLGFGGYVFTVRFANGDVVVTNDLNQTNPDDFAQSGKVMEVATF